MREWEIDKYTGWADILQQSEVWDGVGKKDTANLYTSKIGNNTHHDKNNNTQYKSDGNQHHSTKYISNKF